MDQIFKIFQKNVYILVIGILSTLALSCSGGGGGSSGGGGGAGAPAGGGGGGQVGILPVGPTSLSFAFENLGDGELNYVILDQEENLVDQGVTAQKQKTIEIQDQRVNRFLKIRAEQTLLNGTKKVLEGIIEVKAGQQNQARVTKASSIATKLTTVWDSQSFSQGARAAVVVTLIGGNRTDAAYEQLSNLAGGTNELDQIEADLNAVTGSGL